MCMCMLMLIDDYDSSYLQQEQIQNGLALRYWVSISSSNLFQL